MFDPRALAVAYGLSVETCDLGEWGEALLIAEYDPLHGAIRINQRVLERYRAACGPAGSGALASGGVRALIDVAIAHELYHHREAVGEIEKLPTRRQREEAADAFARANTVVDAGVDAFLTAHLHVPRSLNRSD